MFNQPIVDPRQHLLPHGTRKWLGLTLLQWAVLMCFAVYLAWTGLVRVDSFEHYLRLYRAELSTPSRLVSLHIVLCSGLLLMASTFMAVVSALERAKQSVTRLHVMARLESLLFLMLALDVRFELATEFEWAPLHAVHIGVLLMQGCVLFQYRDLLLPRRRLLVAAVGGMAFSLIVPAIDFIVVRDTRWHVWLEEVFRAAGCLCWIFLAWVMLRRRLRSDPQTLEAAPVQSRLSGPGWLVASMIGTLIMAGAFVAIVPLVTTHDSIFGMILLFHLDAEWNVPAFFSTAMLVVASALAATHACVSGVQGSNLRVRWTILSAGFFYMALDESVSLHEMVGDPVHALLPLKGTIFEFAWVVVAIPFVCTLALYFLPMLWKLSIADRNRLIVAGLVYVGGAVGVETLSGWTTVTAGHETVLYQLTVIAEEGMEMTGLGLVIRALLLMLPLPWPWPRRASTAVPVDVAETA